MGARLLVTPGDPRGIGPEVTLRALSLLSDRHPGTEVALVGPDGPLPPTDLGRIATEHRKRAASRAGASAPEKARSDVDAGLGGADVEAGAFAARSIERAVSMALAGAAEAIVTAPLHKPSLHAAGWAVPGQTEMLASLAEAEHVGMLMAAETTSIGGPLRVLLATTHLPLRDVVTAVTSDLLVDQASLLHQALRTDWGIAAPRVALCALNPHASDGGLFGDEEERVYRPAIERLRTSGIEVVGPLPADTVFSRALGGSFDAVVSPYHDVGMAAFKTVAFGTGVNVTLGLPFIRTSPDHGTAFDIAGTESADATSMLEAMTLALRLANTRFDTPTAHV